MKLTIEKKVIDDQWIKEHPNLEKERDEIAYIFKKNGVTPQTYWYEHCMRKGYEQAMEDLK